MDVLIIQDRLINVYHVKIIVYFLLKMQVKIMALVHLVVLVIGIFNLINFLFINL